MVLKLYTSVAKGLKLKVRKFWGLIPTFVKFTNFEMAMQKFCYTLRVIFISNGIESLKKQNSLHCIVFSKIQPMEAQDQGTTGKLKMTSLERSS